MAGVSTIRRQQLITWIGQKPWVGRLANKLVSSARDQDLAQHPCGQLNFLVKLNRSDHVCSKLK